MRVQGLGILAIKGLGSRVRALGLEFQVSAFRLLRVLGLQVRWVFVFGLAACWV